MDCLDIQQEKDVLFFLAIAYAQLDPNGLNGQKCEALYHIISADILRDGGKLSDVLKLQPNPSFRRYKPPNA